MEPIFKVCSFKISKTSNKLYTVRSYSEINPTHHRPLQSKAIDFSIRVHFLIELARVDLCWTPDKRSSRHSLFPVRHESLSSGYSWNGKDKVRREAPIEGNVSFVQCKILQSNSHCSVSESCKQISVRLQTPGNKVFILLRDSVQLESNLQQGVVVNFFFQCLQDCLDMFRTRVSNFVDTMSISEEAFLARFHTVNFGLAIGHATNVGHVLVSKFDGAAMKRAVWCSNTRDDTTDRVWQGGGGKKKSCGGASHFVIRDERPESLEILDIAGIWEPGFLQNVTTHVQEVFNVSQVWSWRPESTAGMMAVCDCTDDGKYTH